MELIDARTIVATNKGLNQNYLAAEYNMNLYHGCPHGCIYCYARGAYWGIKEFDRVRAKKDALKIVRDDLQRKVKPGIVSTGGMSDPYNPEEAEHKLTRNCLELLNAFEFGICVLTKSALVTRDIDVFQDIREHSPVNVSVSITCAEDELSGKLEPGAPSSSRRFQAIEELSNNGIIAGVLLDPVMPYLTDTEENIREIVRRAKAHGARYVYASMSVTMEGVQREYFYEKAETVCPGIAARYRKSFDQRYRCHSPKGKKLYAAYQEECDKQGLLSDMRAVNQLIRAGYSLSSLEFRGYSEKT